MDLNSAAPKALSASGEQAWVDSSAMSCVCEACEEGAESVETQHKSTDLQEPWRNCFLFTGIEYRGDWGG